MEAAAIVSPHCKQSLLYGVSCHRVATLYAKPSVWDHAAGSLFHVIRNCFKSLGFEPLALKSEINSETRLNGLAE